MHLEDYIRDIPDFPKPGILFRDITPLLASPDSVSTSALRRMADHFAGTARRRRCGRRGPRIHLRRPLALRDCNAAFVPIRKPGKLPFETHAVSLRIWSTAPIRWKSTPTGLPPARHVLVVDDLLATGGTIDACCRLLDQSGASIVGCAFAVELIGLKGSQRIAQYEVFSVIQYA